MASVTLNGETFQLRDEPPKAGRLMLLARAESRGDKEAMVAYLDFLEAMLHPDAERRLFEECIAEMELEDISEALRDAAESYRVDPSSAGRESSSHSEDGQPVGERTSRVVSFSQGTSQAS